PDLLLFNGGALKPPLLQERIRQAVKHWFGADRLPGVLENPDLDLAVSRGAAYYGLVKAGQGVRVGSGSARGYYLEVGDGADGPPRALCLMERGVEEGTVLELADRQFVVLTNQPVSFQVYSSSFRSGDKAGDLVEIDDTLTRLPPIRTVIQFGKKAGQQSLPVHIEARYTELGALELWCASLRTEHRWRLQFQLRDTAQKAQVVDERIFEEEVVTQALAILEEALKSSSSPQTLEKLANTLAQAVEMPKEKWPLSLIRRFADFLLEKNESRLVSPAHLIRWQNLAGFCMRPGFGDALDEHRCRSIWPLFQKGQAFSNNQQARQEWWVLWRRVAGGLTAGQQRQIIQTVGPVIRPKKGAAKLAAQEALEIWMLIGNLERLLVKDKIDFGRHLLQSIKPGKAKPQELWALSRLGARELLYGPLDRVIPVEEAVNWIDSLLSMEWKNPRPAAQALCLLARKTGDRKRDVPPPAAKRVMEWLAAHNGTEQQIKMVTSPVVDDRQLQEEQFGEGLPSGIVLS
ncbi:MAG: molecular chaperone DnaK, partial [Desulfatibacillaceae bacterium]|nr:molecular chaperone DnaK [Desulfatibacillaceae bacterium]